MSHLFNQASVSSEALKDNSFRVKLNEKAEENNTNFSLTQNFNSNDFTVTLGIITKGESERPKIPFFSKVAIRYAQRTITNLGYKFSIKAIKKV